MNKVGNKTKGILLAIIGAIFWGGSGVCAQYIMQNKGASTGWLVSVRMLFAGILILFYLYFSQKNNLFTILKNKKDMLSTLIFSVFGVIFLQYAFFAAIQVSNAATATILQYLSPIFIVIYFIFESKKIPNVMSMISIALSLFGTALLVTKGDFGTLSISVLGLFWGLMAGFFGAFYIIQPRKIMAKYGTTTIIGWGMFFGGLLFQLYHPVWKDVPELDLLTFGLVCFIVVFGTILSYICLLKSTRYIPAQFSSLLTSFEPLSSALFSSLFLGVVILPIEIISMVIIIFSVFLLSRNSEM
ncbi:DMT family transporter [Vagococcus carniphilus]|uniref:DMT family transporter n=1 Tax=Vagococcus carniphilus TaxID=218144 RepID=A0AAW8U0T5_9ENTE|nr:DMT family transporter [Vagococcus carniphilus]MDT2829502.1 DMT family transporter [Vagococcus carniphilus]MDT2833156.1 DMT family transporter [Vagococcus carniphilus]MDT2838961.1 DMT family transporter [Vagococcus carniphilus]MDT2847748.1 DMT family transporter [Vagococcus carniphilus]MDT2853019.1 DMT family transporter [Vagococcus carniphilus]